MLPLETRAELAPSAKASLLKVVSLAEFAQSALPSSAWPWTCGTSQRTTPAMSY